MELLKRIQELLKTKDVTATLDGDNDLMFHAMAGSISLRIYIKVTEAAVSVRGLFPLFTTANRRQAMCEALTLANWQLKLARFELDTDGEIRCRADMPLYDGVPTDKQLTRLIYSVWNLSGHYAPAFVEIMTTQADPALAIARVETGTEPTQSTRPADMNVN